MMKLNDTYFVLVTCSVGTYPVGAISVGVCTFNLVGNIFIFENENQFQYILSQYTVMKFNLLLSMNLGRYQTLKPHMTYVLSPSIYNYSLIILFYFQINHIFITRYFNFVLVILLVEVIELLKVNKILCHYNIRLNDGYHYGNSIIVFHYSYINFPYD